VNREQRGGEVEVRGFLPCEGGAKGGRIGRH
jgi:hypothetical protein